MSPEFQPEIIAHATNTKAEARRASLNGQRAELDIAQALDGTLVLNHSGPGGLLKLGESFEAGLRWIEGGSILDVHHPFLKGRYVEKFVEAVQESGIKDAIVSGRPYEVVSRICELSGLRAGYGIGRKRHLDEFDRKRSWLHPASYLSIKDSLASENLIKRLQDEGVGVLVWGVFNNPRREEELAKLQVDAIISSASSPRPFISGL